ncbi:MAG: hypothetical protein GOU99_03305, partial [Candidatus Altiarchaeota archaeon]|nr:hypothetical protein [Candidatus Altiarchaeota archaeon]
MKARISGKARMMLSITALALLLIVSVTTNLALGNPVESKQVEHLFEFELWVGTELEITLENDSLKTRLILDNETGIFNQKIVLFDSNQNELVSNLTDQDGFALFNSSSASKAEFLGNKSIYLNPSEAILGVVEISDFSIDTNSVNVFDSILLETWFTGPVESITNVSFIIMHSDGEVVYHTAIQDNDRYYFELQAEKTGLYIWKAIYAFSQDTLIAHSRPEISVQVIPAQPGLTILYTSITNVSATKFIVTANITAKNSVAEDIVAKLTAPSEVNVSDEVQTLDKIEPGETVELAWTLDVLGCGVFSMDIGVHNSESVFEYLNLSVPCNDMNISIETIQMPAESGKPVKWKKKLTLISNESKLSAVNVSLPKIAENISFRETGVIIETENEKRIEMSVPVLEGELTELEVDYETQAPTVEETVVVPLSSEDGYLKQVDVWGVDEIHYQNVQIMISFPEQLYGWLEIKWINGTVPLFDEPTIIHNSITGDTNARFQVNFLDMSGNGIPDTVSMIVPTLSGQSFTFGGKSCMYWVESVSWGASGAKGSGIFSYSYDSWDFEDCPGSYECVMNNISTDTRYINTGSGSAAAGDGFIRISNYAQRNCETPSSGSFTYYSARLNQTLGTGVTQGPYWECGSTGSPNTCAMTDTDGFNGTEFNCTSVQGAAYADNAGKVIIIVDTFNVNYTWCWTAVEPIITNNTVDPTPNGWGTNFNFSAAVEDQADENDWATLYAWHTSVVDPETLQPTNWSFVDKGNATNTSVPYLVEIFYNNYTCDNITNTMYYKFNATDEDTSGNWTSETGVKIFSIIEDSLSVTNVTPSFNQSINRSVALNFTSKFWDDTRNSTPTYLEDTPYTAFTSVSKYSSNDSFQTYYDGTNTSGYLLKELVNNTAGWCQNFFYVGQNYWKSGSLSATCYVDIETGGDLEWNAVPFWLMGDLSNSYIGTPDGSQNFTQQQDISFTGTVEDDCDDVKTDTSGFATLYNISQGTSSYLCSPVSDSFSCSRSLPITAPTGWYNVKLITYSEGTENKKYWNGSNTETNAFYLNAYRDVFNQSVDPSSAYYTYENWNFSVAAISGDTVPMDVKLYLKKGSDDFAECSENICLNITPTRCVNCINSTIYWYRNFTDTDVGTWFYKIVFVNNNTGATEDETSGTDSFDVNQPSVDTVYLENITQDPASAQWGGTEFKFNVTVNSTGSSNVTVFLWTGPSFTGPWGLVNQTNYSIPPGGWQELNFTTEFSCGDVGTNYFFFNATDFNASFNESTPQSFEITKDTVLMEYTVGHGSTANRSGDQTDLLVFKAQNINGTILTNFPIEYKITTDNTSYYSDSNFVILTNSTGHAEFYFNATCQGEYSGAPKFLKGEQQWKALINDSELGCYYQNDTSGFLSRNLFVWGDLANSITFPDGSENFTSWDTVLLQGYIDNDCGESMTISESSVWFNLSSGSYQTACTDITRTGANVYYCNWHPTQEAVYGWYNITMYSETNSSWSNETFIQPPETFYLTTLPELFDANITPRSAPWGTNFSFDLKVKDNLDDTVNVTLETQVLGGSWSVI